MRLGLTLGGHTERGIANIMEANALLGEVTLELFKTPPAASRAAATLRKSLGELQQAKKRMQAARKALADLAHFIEDNWHPEYEQHLRSSGFRASHIILAEYEHHLQGVVEGITAAEERWPIAQEAVKAGETDNFLKDFSPGVNLKMRSLCRRMLDMAEFQHRVAETRYVRLSFLTAERRRKGT